MIRAVQAEYISGLDVLLASVMTVLMLLTQYLHFPPYTPFVLCDMEQTLLRLGARLLEILCLWIV